MVRDGRRGTKTGSRVPMFRPYEASLDVRSRDRRGLQTEVSLSARSSLVTQNEIRKGQILLIRIPKGLGIKGEGFFSMRILFSVLALVKRIRRGLRMRWVSWCLVLLKGTIG